MRVFNEFAWNIRASISESKVLLSSKMFDSLNYEILLIFILPHKLDRYVTNKHEQKSFVSFALQYNIFKSLVSAYLNAFK
jgi:hypothetical protein